MAVSDSGMWQVVLFRKLAIQTIQLEQKKFASIESGRKWYNRALGTSSKKHAAAMEFTEGEKTAIGKLVSDFFGDESTAEVGSYTGMAITITLGTQNIAGGRSCSCRFVLRSVQQEALSHVASVELAAVAASISRGKDGVWQTVCNCAGLRVLDLRSADMLGDGAEPVLSCESQSVQCPNAIMLSWSRAPSTGDPTVANPL